MSFGLHAPLFGSTEVDRGLDASAQVVAFLEVEAALAEAQAQLAMIPADAAGRIADAARSLEVPTDDLAAEADAHGNVVIPLVRRLRDTVAEADRRWVHLGATSQDIVDTGHMLLARRTIDRILDDLGTASDQAAALAAEHVTTPMIGRTLLRSAEPITFGLKAARWTVALEDTGAALARSRDEDVAVQLGGPAGVDPGGDRAPELAAALADRLGLAPAPTSWHTDRRRITALASALAAVVGTAAKTGGDVALAGQDEIAELRIEGAGGSSSMPHKRNPVDAVMLRAAAIRAPGLLATVFTSMGQEHERAAGAWHAEWEPMLELLHLAGGAGRRIGQLLDRIEVDAEKMAENLAAVERDADAAARSAGEVEAAAALARRLLAGRRTGRIP